MVTQNRREATRRIAAILRQQGSPLAPVVGEGDEVQELSRRIREKIVDALGEEFAAKGLEKDSEPNAYGLEIEALTDACGLARDEAIHLAREAIMSRRCAVYARESSSENKAALGSQLDGLR